MGGFAGWVRAVLADGESAQPGPPRVTAADRRAAAELLAEAFRLHALDVGGPPLAFDPGPAVAAAEVLADGCWLACGAGPGEVPPDRLGSPRTASAHLSADVCLRLMPAVFRRLRPRGEADPGAAWAADILRRWPLAGVLADLPGGPADPPEFAGHAGLQVLYAERLAERPRAGWVPPDGLARDQAERVFARLGKPLPEAPKEPS